MTTLFVILIIVASLALAFVVLIQNPKGGGLAGSFAGVSSQFMGVKQTNDVLERGTWIFAGIIGVLCLLATFFISGAKSTETDGLLKEVGTAPVQQQRSTAPTAVPFNNGTQQAQPQQQAAPATPAPATPQNK